MEGNLPRFLPSCQLLQKRGTWMPTSPDLSDLLNHTIGMQFAKVEETYEGFRDLLLKEHLLRTCDKTLAMFVIESASYSATDRDSKSVFASAWWDFERCQECHEKKC